MACDRMGLQYLRRAGAFIERHSLVVVLLAVLAYSVYFSWFTILNHHTYGTSAYDLGIYMQSLWTTLHGYGLFFTALWEGSRFAYHFEPVLFGLLPLYAVLPHAETLLVLQSVAIGSGAVPVYLLARRQLGQGVGLIFAVLYLLYPAVHAVNSFDFHATALAIPLLLSSHYCLSIGRLRWGVILAVLALTCRENVSLVVFLMGAYWAWRWRRPRMMGVDSVALPEDRRFLVALAMCLAAAVWFVLAVHIAIPYFGHAETPPSFARYDGTLGCLGVDPAGKLLYLLQVFGPLLFTSLLAPGTLLIGLPVFAQNLLAFGTDMYQMTNQYAAILIPFVFVSSIGGVKLLADQARAGAAGLRYLILALMLVSTCVFSLLYSNSPIALGRGFPEPDLHSQIVDKAVELVPADASIYTQNDLFTHVCHRANASSTLFRYRMDFFEYDFLYGGELISRVDGFEYEYILVDTRSNQSLFLYMTSSAWERLYSDYGVYARGDGVFLYRLGWTGVPIEMTAS
jgi:uncharacterized membrane protein